MEIRLANTRGFCAGVDRAIEIVKKVIEIHGAPVYVKHEVVHNKTVVQELKNLGAIFVEDIEEIPEGEVVVYSAHGISKPDESWLKISLVGLIDYLVLVSGTIGTGILFMTLYSAGH